MLWCSVCHRQHAKENCPKLKSPTNAPLETPSHNGEYLGTVPVKVLPPGFSLEDDGQDPIAREKANKGRAKQYLFARSVAAVCTECGKAFTKSASWTRRKPQQCSDRCYDKAWKKRREKNSAQA